MSDKTPIQPIREEGDQIDFNKLRMVVRNHWLWIVLIFLVCNGAAYLYIRYTKNVYESESMLKLDIKQDASVLGITHMTEEPGMSLLSGEIEIIRSKLFLNRVLDEVNFEVSFFSIGHLLTEELYRNAPAEVTYFSRDHSRYNERIIFRELSPETFELRTEEGLSQQGRYGKLVSIGTLDLILHRNDNFRGSDELGYYFIIRTRDVLLEDLLDNLTAEPININANTVRVSYRDYNPYKAQYVLNKIDTIYLQYSNEQKNLANKQKIEWINHELRTIEKKMESFEDYFENFTLRNKTHDLNEDLKKTIAALSRIDSQQYNYQARVREIEHLIGAVASGNPAFSSGIRRYIPERVSQQLEALQELTHEQEKLKLSYKEVTFAYRQKEQDIRSLREKTTLQLTEIRDRWQEQLLTLERQKAALEDEFVGLPDKNTEFTKNQRFYKLYEEFYLLLMQSKSEFEIAQAGTIPDFKILASANLPATPIFPQRYLIMGIGMVASIVLVLFFVAGSYLLNNRINNTYELERADMPPLLGSVPMSGDIREDELHVTSNPRSVVSEAIRTLRTNLEFLTSGAEKKVMAISSTVSGEGKSFIAMNLGAIIACSEKKTILVDLDMRKSGNARPLGVTNNGAGVSTVLIRKHSWRECVANSGVENLDYLPSGPQPPNPSELLMRKEFAELLNELRSTYDVVILDTPPVGLVTDGIMAMKLADISLYVFRANYSRRDFVNNLQRVVSIHKFTNISTLLNAVSVPGRTYGYGYYDDRRKSTTLKRILKTRSA